MSLLVLMIFVIGATGVVVVDSWPKRMVVFCACWGMLSFVVGL